MIAPRNFINRQGDSIIDDVADNPVKSLEEFVDFVRRNTHVDPSKLPEYDATVTALSLLSNRVYQLLNEKRDYK